jgi:membrane fusion protein (multidrug efflux system)
MLGGVVVVLIAAAVIYFTGGRYVSTDDAYVHVAGVDVSSNLAGRVVEVDVKENQLVKAGQVLFRLDPVPYVIAVEAAQAQVADSRQQLEAQLAAWRQRQVELKNAQDAASYAERERKRSQGLLAAGAVSQAEYDQASRQADAARNQVGMAQQQLAQALAALGGHPDQSIDAHPSVREASAQLARAKLQQGWTEIRAPQDGRVTKVEQLQVGNYINAAAPVFHLVTDRAWVEASFKENQLRNMRAGQSADIRVDAYPSVKCTGVVDSLAPGTDQTFSMMPAENASGNWVKVVQRLPVRLHFSCNPSMIPQGGLSARVKVDTGKGRGLFGSGR